MALQPDLRGLAHTQGHMVGSIHSSNHLDRERVPLPGPPPVRALHDGTADPRAGLGCTGTKINDQTMSSLHRLSAATVVNDDRLQPFDQQPITTIRVIVGFEQPFELEEHWSQGHLPISLRGTSGSGGIRRVGRGLGPQAIGRKPEAISRRGQPSHPCVNNNGIIRQR